MRREIADEGERSRRYMLVLHERQHSGIQLLAEPLVAVVQRLDRLERRWPSSNQ